MGRAKRGFVPGGLAAVWLAGWSGRSVGFALAAPVGLVMVVSTIAPTALCAGPIGLAIACAAATYRFQPWTEQGRSAPRRRQTRAGWLIPT